MDVLVTLVNMDLMGFIILLSYLFTIVLHMEIDLSVYTKEI